MNLFLLSLNPKELAEYHCDKHVVKMIIELIQMLYTAHHILQKNSNWIDKCRFFLLFNNAKRADPYKSCYISHPMCMWVRNNKFNYSWTVECAIELCLEYEKRYKKEHSCFIHVIWLKLNKPKYYIDIKSKSAKYVNKDIPKNCSEFPLCMPEKNWTNSGIDSYRNYYMADKRHIANWKTKKPFWFL